MLRYVFLSNSSKPTDEEQKSRDPVPLTNVSRPCLQTALDMGYEVWFGINRDNPDGLQCELPVHMYDSHTYRSLLAINDNWTAYENLMNVLKQGGFDTIHCNTPIGGAIGRFCGKKAKVRKIIYTAHGFHFYKGAPLINRTVLKWAEMIMAHWTDAIITMNREDFESAKKFRLKKGGKVYYTPGVGIDTEIYQNVVVDRQGLRGSLGLQDTDIVCISMGDLIPRKNYGAAIKAVSKTPDNIHYLICGRGAERENLEKLAEECGVKERIHFLGCRTDIKELLQAADIFLFTTLQEGMPRSMMEAMASGLPCIASKIRGNIDLLEDGVGGYLMHPEDADGIADKIRGLSMDRELREKMKQANLERIKEFDVKVVKKRIEEIYREVLG